MQLILSIDSKTYIYMLLFLLEGGFLIMKNDILSKNIKRERLSRNWTMRDLEKASGVSSAQISNFENGKRQPRSDTLEKLASALGVSLNYLLAGKEHDDSTASKKEFYEIFDVEINRLKIKSKMYNEEALEATKKAFEDSDISPEYFYLKEIYLINHIHQEEGTFEYIDNKHKYTEHIHDLLKATQNDNARYIDRLNNYKKDSGGDNTNKKKNDYENFTELLESIIQDNKEQINYYKQVLKVL